MPTRCPLFCGYTSTESDFLPCLLYSCGKYKQLYKLDVAVITKLNLTISKLNLTTKRQ